jgi:hypothetical protein
MIFSFLLDNLRLSKLSKNDDIPNVLKYLADRILDNPGAAESFLKSKEPKNLTEYFESIMKGM